MSKYELWLDESGDFVKDTIGKEVPSIVGGLLVPVDIFNQKKAEELFVKLCQNYSFNPETFHSTELSHKKFATFAIDLLEEFDESGLKVVVFENLERLSIVDGDTTYLNLLSEGIIQLFQTLSLDGEPVEIKIITALRMSGKSGYRKRMELDDYLVRLEEKLTIGIARRQLQASVRNWKWTFEIGSARKDSHLKLADTICHTYFRRDRKFSEEQQDRIEQILDPLFLYTIFEHETLSSIKSLLSEGRVGNALFEWVASDRLSSYKRASEESIEEEIVDQLIQRLKNLPHFSQKTELTTFLASIQQLNSVERDFHKAKMTIEKITGTLIPEMKKHGFYPVFFFLDVYFSLFTTATHQGDIALAQRQISKIKELLPQLGNRFENIDIILDFMIREGVHGLNTYDFDNVIKNMGRIESFLSEVLTLLPAAGDIAYFDQQFQSDTKGKVYGTRLQAYLMKAREDARFMEDAVRDSNLAIAEFGEQHLLMRQYQYRSQIECDRGNCTDAYQWLCRSYEIEIESSYEEFLLLILNKPKVPFIFGLMHFTRLLAGSYRLGKIEQADEMYQALIKTGVEERLLRDSTGKEHPYEIIFWKIGSYLAQKGNLRASQSYFTSALEICKADSNRLTLQSIGLGILFEQAALFLNGGDKFQRTAQRVVKEAMKYYSQFMSNGLPEAMEAYFTNWSNELDKIDSLPNEEKRDLLFQLSLKIPY